VLGGIFSVLSAMSFALGGTMTRRGMLQASASFGLYVTVILGVPLFALAALATGQIFDAGEIPASGYLLLAGAGILHFLVGRYCGFRAVAAIGANRNQPLLTTSILYSVIMAIVVLGESITWPMFWGMVLIVIGPVLMIERSRPRLTGGAAAATGITNSVAPALSQGQSGGPIGLPASALPSDPSESTIDSTAAARATSPSMAPAMSPDKPKPEMPPLKLAEGYFFGLAAAAIYGNTPIMVRAALQDSQLGIMGGLASYLAASVVLMLALLLPGKLMRVTAESKTAGPWFYANTIASFFAQMFRYMALAIAPVTVVAPLARTLALFTLAFSFLINRRLEYFGGRVIIGILLSVVGSVMLVLEA
jgi:drug/metabolite transporter (DMT)-like permease